MIFNATQFIRCLLLIAVVGAGLASAGRAAAQSVGQETYDTPDAAVAALKAACESPDEAAALRVFGPEVSTLGSGELVSDANEKARLIAAVKQNVRPVAFGKDRVVLYLGALNWPFPVPLMKNGEGRWYFDTAAGREEILNRRIGRNELATIVALQAFAAAEEEYAKEDRDGDGVLEYAQKVLSSDGAKDGLYWKTAEGEPPSPLGELAAAARAEGYTAENVRATKSLHGYVYKLLTRQGKAAVGGARDYIADGNMVHGFAVLAYPVTWGSSGVMTFVIGPDGRVFERNFGPKTTELASAITEYNPDKSWKLSEY